MNQKPKAKKPKSYKLTKSHLSYFRQRVRFWHRALGACDLEINAFWSPGDDNGYLASYTYDEAGGYATIYLSREWDMYPSERELDKTAFHEVFEACYIYPLRYMASSFYSFPEVDRVTHSAVRKAENSIWKAMRGYGDR